jgi:hypothetical protein
LRFACSTGYTRVIVDDCGFLSFVSWYFLQLEDRSGAQVDTHAVAITFVKINCHCDHVYITCRVAQGMWCNKSIVWRVSNYVTLNQLAFKPKNGEHVFPDSFCGVVRISV